MVNTADSQSPADVVIVGGGAAGVLTATQLLRLASAPLRIVMVEPSAIIGNGVAYATAHAEHLLNVPVKGMSAFADAPDDFLDYLQASGQFDLPREQLAGQYVPRRLYGGYLRDRLQRARDSSPASLDIVQASVIEAQPRDGHWQLLLQDGRSLQAGNMVLCVGNRPRPLPARGGDQLAAGHLLEAWQFDAIKRIPADAAVCIVGSGLSMVDSVLSLIDNGHAGEILVVSRHGLMPLAHVAASVPADIPLPALLAMGLRQRVRLLREAARGQAQWQTVLDALRPHVQALWQSLSFADQRRFLRHVVRQWDIHRHRIAPQVHAQLQQRVEGGQLRILRGRLDTVTPAGQRVRLCLRHRGQAQVAPDVDVIINATGVEMRVQTMRNPLLSELLGTGLVAAGAHGVGIRTDAAGHAIDADGRTQANLFAIGSLRIGDLWESIAVPELRMQAQTVARTLLGA
ncbi:FAD/NAD(P)-binding protein [Pseudoxanthomonas dokdonensis]|uniref:FAD-dependent urate hydroxylase HpyO/Asp monooxygenase CreE-like FAD/NAD(P)-binding domain-containing protein n=1 Tax=Pseudoxanthomonas dokdonensis TaxID=344882 RepID=A0A0R0CQ79_9GAMM|nr:FAD/NAD(P)-binding protein [Pseudoxanthomonas dokdonensis]KRG68394.1 hypothetical protein ABB29_13385 [Pseudoxanthomonas dokdonensis]